VIFGGTQGTGTIVEDRHVAPWYHSDAAGAEGATSVPLPAGSLTNFKVVLSAAPGTGVWTVHVLKDGVSQGSCTISAAATSCTIAGPFAFADGNRLNVLLDETTAGAAATRVAFKADYAITP
jgi:hypothetical protein